jgi:hypothetical protein
MGIGVQKVPTQSFQTMAICTRLNYAGMKLFARIIEQRLEQIGLQAQLILMGTMSAQEGAIAKMEMLPLVHGAISVEMRAWISQSLVLMANLGELPVKLNATFAQWAHSVWVLALSSPQNAGLATLANSKEVLIQLSFAPLGLIALQ